MLQARAANQQNKWQGKKKLSHTHKHHTINEQEVRLEALDSAQSGISLLRGGKALKERKGQKVPSVGYLFKRRAEGGELSNDSGGYCCRGKEGGKVVRKTAET